MGWWCADLWVQLGEVGGIQAPVDLNNQIIGISKNNGFLTSPRPLNLIILGSHSLNLNLLSPEHLASCHFRLTPQPAACHKSQRPVSPTQRMWTAEISPPTTWLLHFASFHSPFWSLLWFSDTNNRQTELKTTYWRCETIGKHCGQSQIMWDCKSVDTSWYQGNNS